jgi:acyl-CoA thioesterase-1
MTRCVFFGDSITVGQYVHPRLAWPALLADSIDLPVEYTLCAVNGDTTRLALERFGAVQTLAPDVLVIQFGLNDCNRWQTDGGLPRVSKRAFAANLIEMVERARHFGTQEVILLTSHPTLRSEEYEQSRRCYNEIVRTTVAESGATLADIDSAFPEDGLPLLLLDPPDVLHLSPNGHRFYADLLAPFIRAALT